MTREKAQAAVATATAPELQQWQVSIEQEIEQERSDTKRSELQCGLMIVRNEIAKREKKS